ncbi:MAG: hypothetical protein EAZ43_10455 [Betaproteobacteria bacterium]|nr:MAG: hypothetical protein EAZ43_10455 [Betaproteobacteria bacterium]
MRTLYDSILRFVICPIDLHVSVVEFTSAVLVLCVLRTNVGVRSLVTHSSRVCVVKQIGSIAGSIVASTEFDQGQLGLTLKWYRS